jgi:uncharacterized protein
MSTNGFATPGLTARLFKVLFAGLLLVLVTGCDPAERLIIALRTFYASRHVAKEPAAAPSSPLPAAVADAPWTSPILYRIATRGKPFYVLGTIHIPDYRLDTFPPELEAALAESDAVLTEIALDPATQALAASAARLPPEKTLLAMLPPPVVASVAQTFAAEGVPFVALNNLKPWVVGLQVSMLDRQITFALKKPLDAVIYERAAKSGKQTGGLETVREQLAIFDSLSEREQIEFLAEAMNQREQMKAMRRDPLAELLDVYLTGSEDQLLHFVQADTDPNDPLSAKLSKRMIDDRNKLMTERLLVLVKGVPSRTHFFAVGAAHVVGAGGIIARLEKRGFKAERLGARAEK